MTRMSLRAALLQCFAPSKKFWHTPVNLLQIVDEETLKILSQYLEQFQIYCDLTEKFLQLPAYDHINWLISYEGRQAIARIFQLYGNNFENTQDTDLKFSVFVHLMIRVN